MKTKDQPMPTPTNSPAQVAAPGKDEIPPGTFHGEDEIPPGSFHGEDEIPPGGFHA